MKRLLYLCILDIPRWSAFALVCMLIFQHNLNGQTIHASLNCGSWEQRFKSLEYFDSIMYATTNTPAYYMFDMQYNMVVDSIALGSYYPKVYRFHAGRDGNLYAITDTFLLRKTPTGWMSTGFNPPAMTLWFNSSPLTVDAQGIIYFYERGTFNPDSLHIHRFNGTTQTNYSHQMAWPSAYTSCFVADDSGAVWIGTWDGLYRFTPATLTQYYPGEFIGNMFLDAQNRLYFSRDSLVMIRDAGGFSLLDSTFNVGTNFQDLQTSRLIDTTLYIFRKTWTISGELAAITTAGIQYINLSGLHYCSDSTIAFLNFDDLGRYWFLGMASGHKGYIYVQDSTLQQTVSGKVFHDINLSGVYDAGDMPLQNIAVMNNFTGGVSFTNSQGNYTVSFPGVIGTGFWVSQMNQSPWVLTSPANYYFGELWTNTPVNNLDFGYNTTAPPTHLDVASFGMVFRLPPGFTSNAYFYAQNLSTFTVYNVEAWYVHDSLFTSYSSSLPPTMAGPDTAYWIIDSLTPLQSKVIHISLPLAPAVALGTTYKLQFFVNHPIDTNQVNDTIAQTHQVWGSYDPNDKMVQPDRPEKDIAPDELLTYTVRFQNIGTGPAINVVIRDTLSMHLDLSTLNFIGASHHYLWQMNPGNELEITFPNIYLPDSASFPEESVGAVSFTIRPVSGVMHGTEITNEAAIYFDFNAPIITNKTHSIIKDPNIGIPKHGHHELSVWPNPSNDFLWIESPGFRPAEQVQVTIYDLQGRLMTRSDHTPEQHRIHLNTRELKPGYYFGTCMMADRSVVSFRMVKKQE